MEQERSGQRSTNDIFTVLTENREMNLREVEEKIKLSASATHDSLKEHFDTKFAELQGLVQSCVLITSKTQQEMERRASRAVLGKRASKYQQPVAEVPGLDSITNRSNITWVLSLEICRGLCEDLDNAVKTQIDVLCENTRQSTLSRFLFAIQGTEKNSLHGSILGKESSRMIKRLLLRLFWCARRRPNFAGDLVPNSRDNVGDCPDWLAFETLRAARYILRDPCFGPTNPDGSTIETPTAANIKWLEQNLPEAQLRRAMVVEKAYLADAISRHVQDVESYRKSAMKPKRKRIFGSSGGDVHGVEDLFSIAVSTARGTLLQHLSEGRSKARDCAFKHFGFALEGRNDPVLNSSDFIIDVPEMTSREIELHRRTESLDVAIGDADTWGPDLDEEQLEGIYQANSQKLRALKTSFPSLTCTIAYKVKHTVEELPPNSSPRDSDGPNSGEEASGIAEWTLKEDVSLQKAALSFLYEGFRAPSTAVLLRSCRESLKAVHSLALAFRGLILRNLGKGVSAIENGVLGKVYLNETIWEQVLKHAPDNSRDVDNGQGKRVFLFVSDSSRTREKLRKRVLVTRKEYEEYLISQRVEVNAQGDADNDGTVENRGSFDEHEDIDTDIVPFK